MYPRWSLPATLFGLLLCVLVAEVAIIVITGHGMSLHDGVVRIVSFVKLVVDFIKEKWAQA
jgi:hypothetical protein